MSKQAERYTSVGETTFGETQNTFVTQSTRLLND